MRPQSDPSAPPPACWSCRLAAAPADLQVETVLHARDVRDGGPYRSWACHGCGNRNGVLEDRRGDWLLYALEGHDAPAALDWIGSREERERRDRARDWWACNRNAVEEFRQRPPAQGPRRRRAGVRADAAPPPPPPPPPRRPPPPDPAPREDPGPARTPWEILGVGPDADEEEIRRAYREALKRCHPDRVANLDADFGELAHRKAKALRAAYEALLGRLGRG